MTEGTKEHAPPATGHGHHDLPAFRAHHFDTAEQQYESGKLGMWVFLVTEILLFGGLFCWYSVYRANHPEIFVYAHQFLDKTLGGVNTIVLICSSLTMAWAVRAAQIGARKLTVWMLALTLICACGFLGIKYVEYKAKWEHGLLWGRHYQPGHGEEGEHGEEAAHAPAGAGEGAEAGGEEAPVAPPAGEGEGAAAAADPEAEAAAARATVYKPAAAPREGLRPAGEEPDHGPVPDNVHWFFGIYFVMTGLHGVHVVAGMVVILWLLLRAAKGHFSPDYYTPVDLGGLYWHLVDLVWIFLFPLLYLIH